MRVVVGEELDRKTLTEQLSNLSSPVTPLVVIDDIVIRPQRLECRHGQGQEPAGTDNPAHLGNSPFVVLNMLNDVKTGHNVEGAVRVRKVFESRTGQPPFFSHLAKIKGHGFVVNSKGLSELGKVLQGNSRPTPRIKHTMLRSRFFQESGNQLEDDAPPGHKPPVVVLKSEILGVVVDVHPDNIPNLV